MEYLSVLNLIAHSPIKRLRWFAFHPSSLATLIRRRNQSIKLCADRVTTALIYKSCLQPSNEGERVDPSRCTHTGLSAAAHNTIKRNAEVEADYLSRKINLLGSSIERLKRLELGL